MALPDFIVRVLKSSKLRRLAAAAVRAVIEQRHPAAQELIAADIDAAFDAAVNAAARVAGIKVNAQEIRLAVAQARIEHDAAYAREVVAELEKTLARIQ